MASNDPTPPRVALIHATGLAVAPIEDAFARHWREAQRMNLLDDSLSLDRARDGELTDAMVRRFIELRSVFVPQAMDDLAQGRAAEHGRKTAAASRTLADCDTVMLAQFSMAAAAPLVEPEVACHVLTSPDCALLALQRTMAHV